MAWMSLGYSVRVYELLPDGGIDPLHGSDITYFGGSCPNVGDTIGRLEGLDGCYTFYSVQKRMFIDTVDGDQGWAVLVRTVEASPLMSKLMREWINESKSWHNVDDKEERKKAREGHKEVMKIIAERKALKRASSRFKTSIKKKD